MGLFDAFLKGTGDPEKDAAINRGLIAAGLQLMQAKGRLFPAVGQAGMAGIGAADQMMAQQQQAKMQALQRQMMGYQVGAAQREEDLATMPSRHYTPPSKPGIDATGGMDTALEAPRNQAGPGGFNEAGFMAEMKAKYPMQYAKLVEEQQKAAQITRTNAFINSILGQQGGNPQLSAANDATQKTTGSLAPTVANAAVQSQFMGQQQAPRGGVASLPPEGLAFALAGGDLKGIASELMQRTRPNVQMVSGVPVDLNNLPPGFSMPQMNPSGQGYQLVQDGKGGYKVVAPQGALQTYSDYKTADALAQAGTAVQEVWNPVTQRMELVSKAQALGLKSPVNQAPPPGSPNRPMVDLTAGAEERRKILQTELDRELAKQRPDPQAVASLKRELASVPGGGGAVGMPTGPSMAEKRANEATGLGNAPFMKDSYYPTLDAGKSAQSQLVTIQTARNALRNMGDTGWGTPTKAAVASVLGALGVSQAERYATNAQQFQQAGMTRLWEVLNAAKGPQTEGDAARAEKTFAQLKDTKDKNLYTLDLMQATAEREQAKAKFFAQALPIAQQRGDLQEIEREWMRLAPSVFAMPSMKKWAK